MMRYDGSDLSETAGPRAAGMLQPGNGLTACTDRRTGNTPQICGLWLELLGQANRVRGLLRIQTQPEPGRQDGVLFQKSGDD